MVLLYHNYIKSFPLLKSIHLLKKGAKGKNYAAQAPPNGLTILLKLQFRCIFKGIDRDKLCLFDP